MQLGEVFMVLLNFLHYFGSFSCYPCEFTLFTSNTHGRVKYYKIGMTAIEMQLLLLCRHWLNSTGGWPYIYTLHGAQALEVYSIPCYGRRVGVELRGVQTPRNVSTETWDEYDNNQIFEMVHSWIPLSSLWIWLRSTERMHKLYHAVHHASQ